MPPQHSLAVIVATAAVLATASAGAQQAAPSPKPAQVQRSDPSDAPHPVDQTVATNEARPGVPGEPRIDTRDRLARVRALEQAIDADRQQLIALITKRAGVTPRLHEDPQLLEIAERLPLMEEELRQLKEMGEREGVPAKAGRP